MYQNSVKRIFSAWDEKLSNRPQLGINYIPGVFQPFIPEQNLHLCLFSFWVCTLFNRWHWGYHTLFNWWHLWYHTHWWGPGCIDSVILSETSLLLELQHIQPEEHPGCQVIVPLKWRKCRNPFFLKQVSWRCSTVAFHHIWALPDTSESHIQTKSYAKSWIFLWVSGYKFVLPRCSTSKTLRLYPL